MSYSNSLSQVKLFGNRQSKITMLGMSGIWTNKGLTGSLGRSPILMQSVDEALEYVDRLDVYDRYSNILMG